MADYDFEGPAGLWMGLPPSVRAAALFALPFIIADFFNYYSAGTALAFSLPVLALFYAGCGGLASKFAGDDGRDPADFLYVGAIAGLALWATSLLVNTIISLIIGTATLGTTLLLGVPYLCLCAPVQLIVGGLLGMLGGWVYRKFFYNETLVNDEWS
ncbi:MAG TPA: hypothetical protein ENI90_09190 [Methylothermaceae bacterium]|nr:hypothetical protein [Methylothermaceae bacterium]